MSVIYWQRLDFRIQDNPALDAAVRTGQPVIPVYIHCPGEEAPWQPGGASLWWLHHSLKAQSDSLARLGGRIILRQGASSFKILRQLLKETGAQSVFWNRRYEPAVIARDTQIKESLKNEGIQVESFNAALLHEPWTIQNQSGKPFQVFTPFWRHCMRQAEPPLPLPPPPSWPAPAQWPDSLNLEELKLLPTIPWDTGMHHEWHPGENGAAQLLKSFCTDVFARYSETRNRPDLRGTSRLSPSLHFGEISPRQIWHAIAAHASKAGLAAVEWKNSQFLAEVGWREFAHHLLFHFPHSPEKPLRSEWDHFTWKPVKHQWRAWQKGQTGYPIVDAGMRELWTTGWMHNRVRMIAASFLIKDLRVSWVEGARWFWDTLVDADLASNTLGWQWTAGCGADAAPYFRIFNPVSQGEKFDPEGHYVRKWIPELGRLPNEFIHAPWTAPFPVLERAGVALGKTYPHPIVDHAQARDAALDAYAALRSATAS